MFQKWWCGLIFVCFRNFLVRTLLKFQLGAPTMVRDDNTGRPFLFFLVTSSEVANPNLLRKNTCEQCYLILDILLIEEILHQLIGRVHPMSCRVLYILVLQDFFHQQSHSKYFTNLRGNSEYWQPNLIKKADLWSNETMGGGFPLRIETIISCGISPKTLG